MKEKLPHSTAALVLGICSIVICCCYGLPGVILGIIGFFQGNKAIKIHNENPDIYNGIGNAKTGKVIAIIGIILGLVMLAIYVFLWSSPEMLEELKHWVEEQQAMQQ